MNRVYHRRCEPRAEVGFLTHQTPQNVVPSALFCRFVAGGISAADMAEKITMNDSGLQVPDQPIIPFIEGDGIGPDIWASALRVFDASV